jgi:hypothetical protein
LFFQILTLLGTEPFLKALQAKEDEKKQEKKEDKMEEE